jgi:hypothetical protein
MFDPLEHPGLSLDRHDRHWRELDARHGTLGDTDPDTAHRISTMQALQWATVAFDRSLSQRCPDAQAHQWVGRLGEQASERRHDLATRQPSADSALEKAIDAAQAAFDMVAWAARSEPATDRSLAYQQQAREDLERLRAYAELGARGGMRWADRFAAQVDQLRPATASSPSPLASAQDAVIAEHPESALYDWAVRAAHSRAATYAADVEPPAAEPGQVGPSGHSDWERLVVHKSATCYLYYCFLQQETDPQVRALWELHLQMELAHLQAAGDLLRRYEDRDPHEVTGSGLPEPVAFAGYGRLWNRPVTDLPQAQANGRHDLVDLLTQQHAQIAGLWQRVEQGSGEDRHAAFGDLARLIAVHEVVEEEIVHPLVGRLDPEDPLVGVLLDEERQISDALADAVRAEAASGRAEVGSAFRTMVRSHARHEEQQEFPRVRAAVPRDELHQMTRVVRRAQEAAPAGEGTLPQTAERVRDALRELSREVSV